MEYRTDNVRITSTKRTPQGGLDLPAALTRSGIFIYHKPDGTVSRELRPAEEVFSEDSLSTLAGAPATVGHPGLVTTANWKDHTVGHVGDTVKPNGRLVESRVRVQHADTVKAVEQKQLVELSCGYTCDVEHTPGKFDGQDYDAVQRNIRYNHVALLPVGGGRAGSDVKLRMDGAAYSYNDDMATLEEQLTASQAEVQRLNGLLAGEKTRADAAEKRVKDIDVDALVNDRLALVQDAVLILGAETKLDGKDDLTCMRDACAKAYPEIKLDEKSTEPYVRGLFEAAVAHAKAGQAAVGSTNVVIHADAIEDKVKAARERNAKRGENAWKGGN